MQQRGLGAVCQRQAVGVADVDVGFAAFFELAEQQGFGQGALDLGLRSRGPSGERSKARVERGVGVQSLPW